MRFVDWNALARRASSRENVFMFGVYEESFLQVTGMGSSRSLSASPRSFV